MQITVFKLDKRGVKLVKLVDSTVIHLFVIRPYQCTDVISTVLTLEDDKR